MKHCSRRQDGEDAPLYDAVPSDAVELSAVVSHGAHENGDADAAVEFRGGAQT